MTDYPSAAPTTKKPGRTLTIIGAVCAVVALIFLPPLFALAGLVLGIIAVTKGDKPAGIYVIVASVVCGVAGMFIGAAVMNAMR